MIDLEGTVERLGIKDGDVLSLRVRKQLSYNDAATLKKSLRNCLNANGLGNCTVFILEPGIDLSILSKEELIIIKKLVSFTVHGGGINP